MEEEQNIRPFDPIISEQIIDYSSDYDIEIDEAINISIFEITQQNELNIKYENDIIDSYNKTLNERRENSKSILFQLNKISKFDKQVKEIYDIIEPIIECYCKQNINYCIIDDVTYDKIFNLINKIRTDKKNIQFLKRIILKDENLNFKISSKI
jgi:hypothetical protein